MKNEPTLNSSVTQPQPLPAFNLDFGSIRSMVEYRFTLLDAYVDVNGLATFVTAQEPIKEKFQELLHDLDNHKLSAKIRNVAGKLVISIFPKPNIGKPRRLINLLLFIATMGTVGLASYLLIFWADPRLTSALFQGSSLSLQVIIVGVSILGIVGIHEMGHVLANRYHQMDATLPYFVPGPPPIGTFGAVIALRAPPGNRDQLFDLGFSGPMAGVLATLIVALVAFLTAPLITEQQATQLIAAGLLITKGWPSTPLFIELIGQLGLRAVPPGYVLVLTQMAFAAEIGGLINFLNLLPVWQLDGGHISRAVFGERGHKLTALMGFAILLLAGYWPFAILLLVLMFASRRPLEGIAPLDDVSSLSNSRKILFGMSLLMLVLTFVIF